MRTFDLDKGCFLFTLDTEQAWGYHDCFDWNLFSRDGQREQQAVERLLEILEEFGITATWAVLGILFRRQFEGMSSDNGFKKDAAFEQLLHSNHPLVLGDGVIAALLAKRHRHEIAFHGYTHRVFDERFMSIAEAEFEVRQWLEAAKSSGVTPKAVVFPRNRIGHLELLRRYGMVCYRGEELVPPAYSLPVLGRALRWLHYYIATTCTPLVYKPVVDSNGMVNLPSSRWLFGVNRKRDRLLGATGLHTLRLRKIAKGIRQAAREKKVIHLWAHPHEFHTAKDFEKLRYLFGRVAEEVSAGRMESVGMTKLAENVLARHAELNKTSHAASAAFHILAPRLQAGAAD
jgi:peptidoglycan/xylan/chitin deacetylase (PgdA/CDA1 family)